MHVSLFPALVIYLWTWRDDLSQWTGQKMKWLVYIVNQGSSGINSAASALLLFHCLISQSVAELCLMFATLRDSIAAVGEDVSTHRLLPPVQLWDVRAKRAFFRSFSTSEAGWPWVDLIPDLRNCSASRRGSVLWLKSGWSVLSLTLVLVMTSGCS